MNQKQNQNDFPFSLAKSIFKIWIVWALVWLIGVAGIVYVLAHFITKFW